MPPSQGVELIVISPAWPAENGGYGIAVRASLRQMLKVFSRVHFLGLVHRPLRQAGPWESLPIDWIHIPIPNWSRWFRFLRSLPRSLPACCTGFASVTSKVRATVGRIHRQAQERGRRVALIYEDLPAACSLPAVRRDWPDLPVAQRSHNVLVKAFDGFQREGSPAERLCWQLELAKIGRFERRICQLSDRMWAISANDAQEYAERISVRSHGVFGISLDRARYAAVKPGPSLNVVHVGTANQRKARGLAAFVRQGWSDVRRQVPEARFVLAGRGTERFADSDGGIDALGFVPDDAAVLERGLVFVNPQQIGSGVKLKSIVAMLAGKALVTTPTGIEGVVGAAGEDFFVAADFKTMAAEIVILLKNRQRALRVAQHARTTAAEHYSEDALAGAVLPLLEDFAALALRA